METLEVTNIIREFLALSIKLIAPAVLTSLAIGMIISIFQTVTSIQEQTLTFAPRILAVAIVFGFTASWSLGLLIAYTEKYFTRITEIGLAN